MAATCPWVGPGGKWPSGRDSPLLVRPPQLPLWKRTGGPQWLRCPCRWREGEGQGSVWRPLLQSLLGEEVDVQKGERPPRQGPCEGTLLRAPPRSLQLSPWLPCLSPTPPRPQGWNLGSPRKPALCPPAPCSGCTPADAHRPACSPAYGRGHQESPEPQRSPRMSLKEEVGPGWGGPVSF